MSSLSGTIDDQKLVDFLGGKRLMFAAVFWSDGSVRALFPNVQSNRVSLDPFDRDAHQSIDAKDPAAGVGIYYAFDPIKLSYRVFLRDINWSGDEFSMVSDEDDARLLKVPSSSDLTQARSLDLEQNETSSPCCGAKDIIDTEMVDCLGGDRLVVAVAFMTDRTMEVYRPVCGRSKVRVRRCNDDMSLSVKDEVGKRQGKSLRDWLVYEDQNERFLCYLDPVDPLVGIKIWFLCPIYFCVRLKQQYK